MDPWLRESHWASWAQPQQQLDSIDVGTLMVGGGQRRPEDGRAQDEWNSQDSCSVN